MDLHVPDNIWNNLSGIAFLNENWKPIPLSYLIRKFSSKLTQTLDN